MEGRARGVEWEGGGVLKYSPFPAGECTAYAKHISSFFLLYFTTFLRTLVFIKHVIFIVRCSFYGVDMVHVNDVANGAKK